MFFKLATLTLDWPNYKKSETDAIKFKQFLDSGKSHFYFEGTVCTLGPPGSNFCGNDEDGFSYFPKGEDNSLTCSGDGSWQVSSSQDPVQTPFCSSNPCHGLSVDNTPALFEQLDCENINGIAWTLENYFNDRTACRLIFCTGGANPDDTNEINLATNLYLLMKV